MAPYGLSNRGWETVGGGQWNAGQVSNPNDWSYSTNYSGNIPEGAQTFDPNVRPDPPIIGPNGEILHRNPLWTQGGDEYYFLDENGNPAGSTGFNGSNVSNAPWNNQPPAPRQGGGGGGWGAQNPYQGGGGQTDPFQGGNRMQPQAPPRSGGGGWGGQTDPFQGGQGPAMSPQANWGGGQTDPYQGGNGWGGSQPTMAGRMLGSMYGQRR